MSNHKTLYELCCYKDKQVISLNDDRSLCNRIKYNILKRMLHPEITRYATYTGINLRFNHRKKKSLLDLSKNIKRRIIGFSIKNLRDLSVVRVYKQTLQDYANKS